MLLFFTIVIILAVLIGVGIYVFHITAGTRLLSQAKRDADVVLDNARREADTKTREIQLTGQQDMLKARADQNRELEAIRKKLDELELNLTKREDTLERKLDTLSVKQKTIEEMERQISSREKKIAGKDEQVTAVLAEQREKLLHINNMSADQARDMLLRKMEDECQHEAGELIKRITDQAQDEAREKSRQIIIQAIQRYAGDQTAEHTVSTVAIPDDAMKGRVIGREGRNIRSFEKATGVDVIIDDTPGMVIVSCFDPVRREIARLSLEKLVLDGRIHPARIEEVVTQTTKEMDETLLKIGKETAQETNLPNLAKAILPMLGRLNYRTSYGQNVLKHSMEVAYLTQVMAAELGLDPALGRRAGLLHDIGKAMDHDQEGGHPQLGMEFLRKFNEPEAVLNAAFAHHGDQPATTPYTPLVMAADAISASRPGARRESLERYIKRLTDLEDVALSFDGVRQAYAIQAGREVRVIVDAKLIDDRISAKIARDIAKRIEGELQYPGEIKITLIREVRSVEYAR